MKLADALCEVCLPNTWNFDKFDDYGDIIEPELCPCPTETEFKIIEGIPVREKIPFDKMESAIKITFTEKNKLYCNEITEN